MISGYKVLYRGGEGEITEKKSRFIATTRPVETEAEALAFIEEMKKNIGMPGITVRLISLVKAARRSAAMMTANPAGPPAGRY